MLLTDRFVYLHQPKTGGTFVASMLTQIHEARGDRVITVWFDPASGASSPVATPGTVVRLMLTTRNQHGARRDIPPAMTGLPILATVRNPYDRYVSQYEFAWWRQHPEMFGPIGDVRGRYPGYPDLSFADFVNLTNEVSVQFRAPDHPAGTPGFHTQQFVEYFFRQPDAAWAKLLHTAQAADLCRAELDGSRVIDQARLNDDLAEALLAFGYREDEADRVRRARHVWPPEGGRAAGAAWQPYYTPELKAHVRQKERWLFEWFPQFDT